MPRQAAGGILPLIPRRGEFWGRPERRLLAGPSVVPVQRRRVLVGVILTHNQAAHPA